MNAPGLLAADIGDLVGFLIFLMFLIISVVGHFANKWREMQEEAARRARARRPAPPRPQHQPLNDEIAEFLRTAEQRRRPGGAPPATPPRPASPPRAPALPPRPLAEQPVDVQVVEPRPGRLRETLSSRRQMVEVSQESQVAQADDRMEGHLHQVFDHQLASLSVGEVGSTASFAGEPLLQAVPLPLTAAAGLTALLASADSLRQAIVLSEILNRPVHRWE